MDAEHSVHECDEESGAKSRKKNDGRLFPDFPLYCEGYNRPKCRGLLHLYCSILLPLGYVHYIEASKSMASLVISVLYLSTNLFCYGISALYHVGKWSPSTEIFLQKLDHCGIAILSTGTMLPVSFLILPASSGLLLISITFIFCVWTCFNIFQGRPAVYRQALTAGVLILFVPQLYFIFNELEFATMLLTFLFQIIGIIVFVNEPNSRNCLYCCCCPSWYGFHEIFHVFVVAAGICVYICNYSIVARVSSGDDVISKGTLVDLVSNLVFPSAVSIVS